MRVPVMAAALVALLAAQLVQGPATPSSPAIPLRVTAGSPSSGDGCADVLLVALRGNGEQVSDTSPVGATPSVVTRQVLARARVGGRSVERRYVSLRAPGAGVLTKGRPVRSPAVRAVSRGRLADWSRGVASGVDRVSAVLTDAAVRCPDQQVLLVGYAQGAMVAHRVMVRLDGRTELTERLVGAVLVSDGDRRSGTRGRLTGLPGAPRTGRGVVPATRTPVTDVPAPGRSYAVWNVCTRGDLVCDLRANQVREALAVHRGYTRPASRVRLREVALQAWERLTEVPLPRDLSAAGQVGVPLSLQLTAKVRAGSESWLRWTATDPMPPGLTLDSAGRIRGTPASAGSWRVGVSVHSALGPAYDRPMPGVLELTVAAAARTTVSAGGAQTCQVAPDGFLSCWGDNDFGQLGDGTRAARSTPARVSGVGRWETVSSGGYTTCGIKREGSLWCWGLNHLGQVGDGTRTTRVRPTRVGEATDWLSVGVGYFNACATRGKGALLCWGANGDGQLGDGSTRAASRPRPVGEDDWASVAVGGTHVCGVRTTGSAWCWGSNDFGQLGDGTRIRRSLPVRVGDGDDWRSLSVGWMHTCGVAVGGATRCWGDNRRGQLGDGSGTLRTTPARVASATQMTSVSVGESHTCAVDTYRQTWCWGDNDYGQRGDGSTSISRVPVEVTGEPNLTQVSASWLHTCGVRTDGQAVCWGANESGQLGTGTLRDSRVPVATRG